MLKTMPRRTIYLPDHIEELVRKQQLGNESFSATVARLIEFGALEGDGDEEDWPEWIGSGEGPGDLGINAEKYLGLKPWGPGEGPGNQSSR
jgi:hypothetical protein